MIREHRSARAGSKQVLAAIAVMLRRVTKKKRADQVGIQLLAAEGVHFLDLRALRLCSLL